MLQLLKGRRQFLQKAISPVRHLPSFARQTRPPSLLLFHPLTFRKGRAFASDTRIFDRSEVIDKEDEEEAAELKQELTQMFAELKGKSSAEIARLFSDESSRFAKVLLRASLNPYLMREVKKLEKEMKAKAKGGNVEAKRRVKEATQLEHTLYSMPVKTLNKFDEYIPKVLQAFDKDEATRKPEAEYFSLNESYQKSLEEAPLPLKQPVTNILSPPDDETFDAFGEFVSRLRGEMPSVKREFRRKLKELDEDTFTKPVIQLQEQLSRIKEIAEEEERRRRAKKAEVDWIVQEPQGDFDESIIGRFISVSDENSVRYFSEGAGRTAEAEIERMEEGEEAFGVIVRPQAYEIIQTLKAGRDAGFMKASIPNYTLIDGPPSCGKSSILASIGYWARANGWLVTRFNSREWTSDAKYHLADSVAVPGLYDFPIVSLGFCARVLASHEEELKNIPLKTDFEIEGFERTKDSTLCDLIEFGADPENTELAGGVVYHFRKELSHVTEYPVLIMIDDINSMFHRSVNIFDPDTLWTHYRAIGIMPYQKLSACRVFSNWKHHGLAHGTVVAALTSCEESDEFFRINEVKREEVKQIPPLSKKEFNRLLDWYTRYGLFSNELNERTRSFIYAVTGGRGDQLQTFSFGK